MSRAVRIETFANEVALKSIKARGGPRRIDAAKRDRLAGLAILVERAASHTSGKSVVHIPAALVAEIRKELAK